MDHLVDRSDLGHYGISVSAKSLVLSVSLDKPEKAWLSLVNWIWMKIWMKCPVGRSLRWSCGNSA